MSLPDQPDWGDGSPRFLGRPIVWVCDQCTRVQDGLAEEDPSAAQWADQETYMTAHGFSYGDVWWSHTTCWTCERFIGR